MGFAPKNGWILNSVAFLGIVNSYSPTLHNLCQVNNSEKHDGFSHQLDFGSDHSRGSRGNGSYMFTIHKIHPSI
jgi:hypothetical protein